jgi:DNA replication protein DnaC
MLHHPTLDKLQQLRLSGMHKALCEQLSLPGIDEPSFEERLGLLADREMTARENRRLHTRLRQARLRQSACLEDLDYRAPRGLDKALIAQLASGHWIREGLNVPILGPTGVGKTWIGCALAHQACRQGYTTRYLRLPRLLEELRLAHADGRFPKLMAGYAKTDLLVLDDWGLTTLDPAARRDLLELLDDRHGHRSTLVTSQLPLEHWHEVIGDPTLADAILDRLVHSAYRITLKGNAVNLSRPPVRDMESSLELAGVASWKAAPWTNGLDGHGELTDQAVEQLQPVIVCPDQQSHEVIFHGREGAAPAHLIGLLAPSEAPGGDRLGDGAHPGRQI